MLFRNKFFLCVEIQLHPLRKRKLIQYKSWIDERESGLKFENMWKLIFLCGPLQWGDIFSDLLRSIFQSSFTNITHYKSIRNISKHKQPFSLHILITNIRDYIYSWTHYYQPPSSNNNDYHINNASSGIRSTVSIKGSYFNLLLIIPLSHHVWMKRQFLIK